MNLPRLWTTGQELPWDPFRAMRREMESALRAFDQNASSPDIGAGAPAISVAETKDAFEVTAELPGVDEKDIKVSLDANQLVISGEKKAESTKEEKDWHVEERSFGSFYRSMSLPFEPEDGAVNAHFVLLNAQIQQRAKRNKTNWLGREGSNLRMAESKSAALPLGYAPKATVGLPAARRGPSAGAT